MNINFDTLNNIFLRPDNVYNDINTNITLITRSLLNITRRFYTINIDGEPSLQIIQYLRTLLEETNTVHHVQFLRNRLQQYLEQNTINLANLYSFNQQDDKLIRLTRSFNLLRDHINNALVRVTDNIAIIDENEASDIREETLAQTRASEERIAAEKATAEREAEERAVITRTAAERADIERRILDYNEVTRRIALNRANYNHDTNNFINIHIIDNIFYNHDTLFHNISSINGYINMEITNIVLTLNNFNISIDLPITDDFLTFHIINELRLLIHKIYTFRILYGKYLLERLHNYLLENQTINNFVQLRRYEDKLQKLITSYNRLKQYIINILNKARTSTNTNVSSLAEMAITYETAMNTQISEEIRKAIAARARDRIIPEEDDASYKEYSSTLIDRITCPVCISKERNTVLNCGHLLCYDCANNPSLTICPVCRTPIVSKNQIFLKKYLKYKNKYLALKRDI